MALLIAAIKCFRGKFTGFQKCYFSSQTKNVIVVLLLLLFIKKISIEQIISSNCLFKKKSKPHAHTTISKVCKSRFNINLVWKFFCCTSSGRETKLEKKEKKKRTMKDRNFRYTTKFEFSSLSVNQIENSPSSGCGRLFLINNFVKLRIYKTFYFFLFCFQV